MIPMVDSIGLAGGLEIESLDAIHGHRIVSETRAAYKRISPQRCM